mmetsp:Transcript_17990/g.41278  ORF Transcript_17990/g.41278 Transcript_17990/m.41278 type:complete len:167 (+) Transcript_17990:225-725(+)
MPVVTTPTTTKTSFSRARTSSQTDDRFYDSRSVTSEGSPRLSKAHSYSPSVSDHSNNDESGYDYDTDTLCASPSLSSSLEAVVNIQDFSSQGSKLFDRCDSNDPRDDEKESGTATSISMRTQRATTLQRCYGNADLSDRIGRTISFVLVTRLILSAVLSIALLDDE